MAGISNDLFPPIIDSYMPGFLPAHGCRVYFSISSYNDFNDISEIEISLKYQDNNISALKADTIYTTFDIDNNISTNYKYYISLSNEILKEDFIINKVYKFQARFIQQLTKEEQEQLKELRIQKENEETKLKENEANINFCNEALKTLEKGVEYIQLQQDKKSNQEEILNLSNQYRDNYQKISNLEYKLQIINLQLQEMEDNGQEDTEEYLVLQAQAIVINKDITQLQNELDSLSSQLSELTENSHNISTEIKEIEQENELYFNYWNLLNQYKEEISHLNMKISYLNDSIISLEKKVQKSEWSTVCLLKPIATPIVNVELFNSDNSLSGDVAISTNIIEFYGNLSWENNDQAEVLYYYQLDLHKKSTDELIESSGMIYTDTNVQVFNYIFQHELEDNEAYYIKLTYCFTSMYIGTEIYNFVYFPFKNTLDTNIELQASDEDGYIAVYIDMENLVPGNYALLRASSDSDFKLWDTYYYFTKDVNAEDIEVVIEDLNINVNKSLMAAALDSESVKSGQYHIYHDHTIQSGVLYKYKIQRLGLNNIRIADSEASKPIMSYFNHMFLGDKDFKLKVKFDPAVDSFKKNITESKIDTLGGKYPIIRRNGASNYQSFSISGLIAIEDEDFENWKKSKEENDEWDTYYYRKYGVRRTNDFVSEKAFRDKVSSYLHDGKVKLFRSVQEGNFLVRLMNISLSAKKELGRMLYSFSAEATEVAECNYNNYIKYNIIEDTEMPEGKVAAFTLPVIGQVKGWSIITTRINRKYNINYNYQTYQLKGAIIPESISYKITNLNENETFPIRYLIHKGEAYHEIQVAPKQTITLSSIKQLICDVQDYWLIEYEGYVEYTYQYANEYSYKVQYINNNDGQLKILANEDIIATITEKYNNEDLYRQIEDITRLTFNNLSDEDIKVNIEYSDGTISDVTIASNNIYTLMSQGSKDIKSIKPESDIYIDYNYILSTKVIESEE